MAVKRYNGTGWEVEAGSQAITYNATAPTSPAIGDVWVSDQDIVSFDNTVQTGFRNAIINGDFRIWQRGTSFTTGSGTYTADRWVYSFNGTGATRTVSQQSFTPGNTISGYEPQYHLRYAQSVAGTGGTYNVIGQRIEDARTFAGQTVTISFWAKAAASTTITTGFDRNYGTGGSSADDNTNIVSHSLTTSWQRFTTTVTIASVSGETIGANSFLLFWIGMPTNATFTIDIWGVQVEKGSTATPFETRPIGTELALCQRYYEIIQPSSNIGSGFCNNTTTAYVHWTYKVSKRAIPSSVSFTGTIGGIVTFWSGSSIALTALSTAANSTESITIVGTVASGLTTNAAIMLNTGSANTVFSNAEL